MSELGTAIMGAIYVRDELVKLVVEAMVINEWTAEDCVEEILKRFKVEPLPNEAKP